MPSFRLFGHGSGLRGLNEAVPASHSFEGRFGRLFRRLPAARQEAADLLALAATMVMPAEPDKPEGVEDEDENPLIPAGYTYLGQFLDHDITFDPASSLERQNDPNALVDFRTPRFDLDSVYGRGPADQPYLYHQEGEFAGVKLALGARVDADPKFAGPDLPRFPSHLPPPAPNRPQARALLGDPRNDENLIVSQLHSAFLQFHNKMVDRKKAEGLAGPALFAAAQQAARWHYQWVVLQDFLPRILGGMVEDGRKLVKSILDGKRGSFEWGKGRGCTSEPDLRFYRPQNEPFIPVEFAVAAYRFGHSMVRPSYFFNDFVKAATGNNRTPIFSANDDPLANLNGFRPLPPKWGFQWKFFFEFPGADRKPQSSYRIDTELVNPLGALPGFPTADPTNPNSLAARNLLRGKSLGLPSGQDVACAMGIAPLSENDLYSGKGLSPKVLLALKGRAPLWYYILREAEILNKGTNLGPVGGRIVAEVFIGLLYGDSGSFLRSAPSWVPDLAISGEFGMKELLTFAGVSVT